MKITKHGNISSPEHYTKTAKCPHCKCEFEYDTVDDTDYDEDSYTDRNLYVRCPECNWNIKTGLKRK